MKKRYRARNPKPDTNPGDSSFFYWDTTFVLSVKQRPDPFQATVLYDAWTLSHPRVWSVEKKQAILDAITNRTRLFIQHISPQEN